MNLFVSSVYYLLEIVDFEIKKRRMQPFLVENYLYSRNLTEKKMKTLITLLAVGMIMTVNAQTFMYINEGNITPESPVSTSDVVSIQLLGDFSDSGGGVDDYNVSLDGFTVNLEINASSEGGLTVLTPFDITYELGMYEPGTYTVEITGTGIGVAIEGPLDFVVEEDGTSSIQDLSGNETIQIYPNPSSEFVQINLEKEKSNYQVQLLSIAGKTIQRQNIASGLATLSVSDLAEGLYFVQILDANGSAVKTERIIVKH